MAASTESCVDEEKRVDLIQRAQWLRAAILGANDGLLSTTALMLGVGAARDDHTVMIVSGLAGALAGACSMAVGEFVSVSTQRDIEQTTNDKCDVMSESVKPQESIVVISPVNHLRESSPHISPPPRSPHISSPPRSPFTRVGAMDTRPNPCKAAGASSLAFLCGSVVPLLSAMAFSEKKMRVVGIVVVTSIALAVFGGAGARLGGLPVRVSAMRVVVGGWISMAITYGLLKPLDRDHKGHQASN